MPVLFVWLVVLLSVLVRLYTLISSLKHKDLQNQCNGIKRRQNNKEGDYKERAGGGGCRRRQLPEQEGHSPDI